MWINESLALLKSKYKILPGIHKMQGNEQGTNVPAEASIGYGKFEFDLGKYLVAGRRGQAWCACVALLFNVVNLIVSLTKLERPAGTPSFLVIPGLVTHELMRGY